MVTELSPNTLAKDDYQSNLDQISNFPMNLPCEGVYKLPTNAHDINYNYCRTEYWKCPNRKCIMNLV